MSEAFSKYLGLNSPAYVPKFDLTPHDAIKIIINAGGIPVLAHPYYCHYSNADLMNNLIESGLKGIEVWHSKHPPSTVRKFQKLSLDLGLIATGGSDCHGSDSPIMGKVRVPYSIILELKDSLKNAKNVIN
jgi:predicted metal-dependent phosphoesterase TrpH